MPVGVVKAWSVDQMNRESGSVGETVDLNIACTWLRMRVYSLEYTQYLQDWRPFPTVAFWPVQWEINVLFPEPVTPIRATQTSLVSPAIVAVSTVPSSSTHQSTAGFWAHLCVCQGRLTQGRLTQGRDRQLKERQWLNRQSWGRCSEHRYRGCISGWT